MSNPDLPGQPPVEPIYVDPVTGAPLQIDPTTGQLTYGSVPTTPLPSAPLPPTSPLPATLPLPAGGLPTAFPTPSGPPPLPGDPAAANPAASYAPNGYAMPYGYPPATAYSYMGQPGYTYPLSGVQAVGRNGLALASMIVSLCSICVGGPVAGLVGAILGHVARRQIRQTGQDGAGMALAGIIVGWAVVLIYGGFIAIGIGSSVWSN